MNSHPAMTMISVTGAVFHVFFLQAGKTYSITLSSFWHESVGATNMLGAPGPILCCPLEQQGARMLLTAYQKRLSIFSFVEVNHSSSFVMFHTCFINSHIQQITLPLLDIFIQHAYLEEIRSQTSTGTSSYKHNDTVKSHKGEKCLKRDKRMMFCG